MWHAGDDLNYLAHFLSDLLLLILHSLHLLIAYYYTPPLLRLEQLNVKNIDF